MGRDSVSFRSRALLKKFIKGTTGLEQEEPKLEQGVGNDAPSRRERIQDQLAENGLFVVGHARSGTSVLHMALNTSPDIFLLGEANLHQHHAKSGFARWYRSMHESFSNLRTKGLSCPTPDDPEGDGWDVLLKLRRHYRFVGDKVAFRSRGLGYDFDGCFQFLQDFFPKAHIIGTLRHPRDVLASHALMFPEVGLAPAVVSYLECLALEIDLLATFDDAVILVHEHIEESTFIRLGEWLNCDLSHAYERCYELQFQGPRHAKPAGLGGDLLELCTHYYDRLCHALEASDFGCVSLLEMARIRRVLRTDIARLT